MACPDAANDAEQLLRRANVALKQARLRSDSAFSYQAGMDEQYLRKLIISQRLQGVTTNGGLELHYQPQSCLVTGKILGAEALLRWTDAELGQVFPDEFIPLAEESGTISVLTQWVLTQVLEDIKTFSAECELPVVSINLSANDLLDNNMLDQLLALARALNLKLPRRHWYKMLRQRYAICVLWRQPELVLPWMISAPATLHFPN